MNKNKFPRWLTKAGLWVVIPTALLAVELTYEQTLLTWRQGPQMVGFTIFHTGIGILPLLASYLGILWVMFVLVAAIRTRSIGRVLNLLLVLAYGASVALLLVPYEWWQLQMVERFGPWDQGAKALHYANPKHVTLIKTLIEKGYDPNYADQYNHTTLHSSVAWGNPDLVRLLLARGAKVDETERLLGTTPLLLAVREQKQEIAGILLEHGADPFKKDKDGLNAFDLAKRKNNPKMLETLEHWRNKQSNLTRRLRPIA